MVSILQTLWCASWCKSHWSFLLFVSGDDGIYIVSFMMCFMMQVPLVILALCIWGWWYLYCKLYDVLHDVSPIGHSCSLYLGMMVSILQALWCASWCKSHWSFLLFVSGDDGIYIASFMMCNMTSLWRQCDVTVTRQFTMRKLCCNMTSLWRHCYQTVHYEKLLLQHDVTVTRQFIMRNFCCNMTSLLRHYDVTVTRQFTMRNLCCNMTSLLSLICVPCHVTLSSVIATYSLVQNCWNL